MASKFRYYPTTQRVSQEGMEDDWFRYNMDNPYNVDWRDDLPVMLDVETHGKAFNDVRLVQVFQEHWEKAIIWDTNHYPLADIYEVIKDKHLIIHNATFELSCFQTDLNLDGCPFKNFSDTFLLARKAFALDVEGFGFDAIAAHVHEFDYYKQYARELGWASDDVPKFKKALQKSFLDSPKSYKRGEDLYYEQLRYAGMDVVLMSKMYKAVKHVEDEWIIQLDYKFIPIALRYQKVGFKIDRTRLEEEKVISLGVIDEMTNLLPEKPGEPGTDLLVNSWVQVRKLFDSDASDDTYLASVENDFERFPDNTELETRAVWAKAIRAKRSAIKRLAFIKSYEHDRVHQFVSPRTKSGRIAGESINLLQIPRSLKGAFGYRPEDNRFIVYADFSNLELRMLACLINEEVMVDKFMNDEDLHTYSGSNIYEKPINEVSKAERFIGKFFNFSAGYGAGAARLCGMLLKEAGIFMEEDDMRPLLKKWKSTFPAIKRMHLVNGRSKDNIAKTLGGRVVKCDLYTDLNAIPPQGSSAEVFKLTMLYLEKNLPGVKLMDAIHDSYLIEVEDLEEGKRVGTILAKCMITAWFQTIQNSQVPNLKMPTTALVGKNWGDIESDIFDAEVNLEGTYEEYETFKADTINGNL